VSQTPPDLIAEATKRAGLIWIAIDGHDRPRPAWHVWRAGTGWPGPGPPGAAYVVTGPGEQPLPGLAGAARVTVIVAGGQSAGGRVEWPAAVGRVEPGSEEWDEVIGPLVAGRLNAVLAEGETSPAQRWAASGAVFRLAPVLEDTAPADTALEDTAQDDTALEDTVPEDTVPEGTVPEDTAPEDTALGDRGPDDTAAPNSRTLLSAALPSVHPDRRLAGHRQRRHSPQRHSHHCGGS
jgi:hypothetical protein